MEKANIISIVLAAMLIILAIGTVLIYQEKDRLSAELASTNSTLNALRAQNDGLTAQNGNLTAQLVSTNAALNAETQQKEYVQLEYFQRDHMLLCKTGLCANRYTGSTFQCNKDGAFDINGTQKCVCDPGCGFSFVSGQQAQQQNIYVATG